MARHCSSLFVVIVALLGAGCADDSARFDAALTSDSGCLEDFFPFEPSFFAASRTELGTFIRMQDASTERTRADQFTISFADENPILGTCPDVDELAGQTVMVGPGTCVQAYFRLNDSCRSRFFDPQVTGQLTFSQLGFERGDRIEGTITGSLDDVKYGDIGAEPVELRLPLGTLDGEFAFDVAVGPPWQVFTTSDKPDRP